MFRGLFKLKNDRLSDFKNGSDNKFVIKDKGKNEYGVSYVPFETGNKVEYGGIYKVFNVKGHKIGDLKFVYYYDKEPSYVVLSDICFDPKYRNIGLGTKLISVFEEHAKSLGAEHIEGDLSAVDDEGENGVLRSSFYIKHGYEIIYNTRIIKHL